MEMQSEQYLKKVCLHKHTISLTHHDKHRHAQPHTHTHRHTHTHTHTHKVKPQTALDARCDWENRRVVGGEAKEEKQSV